MIPAANVDLANFFNMRESLPKHCSNITPATLTSTRVPANANEMICTVFSFQSCFTREHNPTNPVTKPGKYKNDQNTLLRLLGSTAVVMDVNDNIADMNIFHTPINMNSHRFRQRRMVNVARPMVPMSVVIPKMQS
jgi:hypothetical protein